MHCTGEVKCLSLKPFSMGLAMYETVLLEIVLDGTGFERFQVFRDVSALSMCSLCNDFVGRLNRLYGVGTWGRECIIN